MERADERPVEDSTSAPSSAPEPPAEPTVATLPPPDATALLRAACDDALAVSVAATLPAELTSVSGLAGSRRHEGITWAVEDSFEPAEVVALGPDGTVRATVTVQAGLLANLDWEDLAVAAGPDGAPWIHVADIGDNLAIRDQVTVYRFPEPELTNSVVTPEALQMSYPEGRPNAEALVVDHTGLWTIDKDPDGPATLRRYDESTGVLDPVTELALTPGEQVTAADLSPDGTVLALRTNERVLLYPVPDGGSVADALAQAPCDAPSPDEAQGESVTFGANPSGLLTVSEDESGGAVDLHRIAPG